MVLELKNIYGIHLPSLSKHIARPPSSLSNPSSLGFSPYPHLASVQRLRAAARRDNNSSDGDGVKLARRSPPSNNHGRRGEARRSTARRCCLPCSMAPSLLSGALPPLRPSPSLPPSSGGGGEGRVRRRWRWRRLATSLSLSLPRTLPPPLHPPSTLSSL